MSPGNPFILGSKGHESQKDCTYKNAKTHAGKDPCCF